MASERKGSRGSATFSNSPARRAQGRAPAPPKRYKKKEKDFSQDEILDPLDLLDCGPQALPTPLSQEERKICELMSEVVCSRQAMDARRIFAALARKVEMKRLQEGYGGTQVRLKKRNEEPSSEPDNEDIGAEFLSELRIRIKEHRKRSEKNQEAQRQQWKDGTPPRNESKGASLQRNGSMGKKKTSPRPPGPPPPTIARRADPSSNRRALVSPLPTAGSSSSSVSQSSHSRDNRMENPKPLEASTSLSSSIVPPTTEGLPPKVPPRPSSALKEDNPKEDSYLGSEIFRSNDPPTQDVSSTPSHQNNNASEVSASSVLDKKEPSEAPAATADAKLSPSTSTVTASSRSAPREATPKEESVYDDDDFETDESVKEPENVKTEEASENAGAPWEDQGSKEAPPQEKDDDDDGGLPWD